jgi:Acetyltransferase (GNAT) domain
MSDFAPPARREPQPSLPVAPPLPWMTLFNEDRFHALNLSVGQRVLRAEAHDEEGRLVGSLSGVLESGLFSSGFSAPFGGVDLARERETPANVALLVDHSLTQLRAAGARTVRIKLPPACYGESEGLVQFTLLNRGFAVERCELNQHIDLEPLRDSRTYLGELKSPARRALNKLLELELSFRRAETAAEWDRAYQVLAANRAAKGRELALSRSYLERARDTLGEAVRMYELLQGERSIAAALIYRVRTRRDLVVAWGDGEHQLDRSPMNLLAYRVLENALAEGVKTLDLGISNEHDPDSDGALVPNGGLVQFKQSVLAKVQPRLTLIRELLP